MPLTIPKSRIALRAGIAGLAVMALSGCASDETAGSLLVSPGKFTLFTCPDLVRHEAGLLARQRVLEGLIAKAGPDADGRFVSAIAYRPEYTTVRAERNLLRRVFAEKECQGSLTPAPAAGAMAPRR
ncbi:MAG: hypothetical protein Q8M26_12085 [Pseudolabrys sp.]|nr:hypothetical protein [Pseudolabrys sp.]